MIIHRILILSGILLSGIGVAATPRAAAPPPSAQTTATAAAGVTSRITVLVPEDNTELIVDGNTIGKAGTSRSFETGPFARGTTHEFTVTATWQPNTYTTMTRSKTVSFRAGEPVTVDLTIDDPNDRVRVIYVPTPADVAEEMVELAGITRDDVVYEPGCGDARITIAAIKRGARRAICIDIEPERAQRNPGRTSRPPASTTGSTYGSGDALDIKDLSDVTVVFLYMGDHFNMLIRPVLWRDLKVGSRIVSHRFTMGDWTPDKTISVTSDDGGEYELHLWTVTEDVKRRLAGRR